MLVVLLLLLLICVLSSESRRVVVNDDGCRSSDMPPIFVEDAADLSDDVVDDADNNGCFADVDKFGV